MTLLELLRRGRRVSLARELELFMHIASKRAQGCAAWSKPRPHVKLVGARGQDVEQPRDETCEVWCAL